MSSMNEKLKNIFSAEFPELLFDVFSENGLINETSVIFTVFADGELALVKGPIIDFAKTVFNEVWMNSPIEDDLELVFLGLMTGFSDDD